MNDREKKLLLFLLVAVVLGTVLTGTKSYLSYLSELRSDLSAAEQDRQLYEANQTAAEIYELTVDDYEQMS